MKSRWLYISARPKRVAVNLAYMLKLHGFVFLPPAVLSFIFQEYTYTIIFSAGSLLTYLIGTLAYDESYAVVNKTESMVIAALSYVLFSFLGALAFLPGASFINGFFEAMSGYTTTGLTMFQPESLPRTMVFFRSYSQWIGGAGIVILTLAILRIPARTASRIAAAEAVKDELIGSMKSATFLILKVYLVLTAAGYIALLAAGLSAFDALIHVLSGISTGGFSSRSGSIGSFQSGAVNTVMILIMALGAVNFTRYHHLRKKEERTIFFRDPQIHAMLFIIAVFALLQFIFISGEEIKSALFHSASSLTTTGFNIHPASGWPDAQKLFSSIQMVIGGGDGSTAGGIKLFRFIIILYLAGWFIRRSILPKKTKSPVKYNGQIIGNTEMKEIFAFFILYLLILSVSTLIFTLAGHNTFDSLFESVSSLGTVGLSSGITQPSLHFYLKIILIFNMWAGRIEILSVLILFSPFIWSLKRRKK